MSFPLGEDEGQRAKLTEGLSWDLSPANFPTAGEMSASTLKQDLGSVLFHPLEKLSEKKTKTHGL